jgi:hypothetical protein
MSDRSQGDQFRACLHVEGFSLVYQHAHMGKANALCFTHKSAEIRAPSKRGKSWHDVMRDGHVMNRPSLTMLEPSDHNKIILSWLAREIRHWRSDILDEFKCANGMVP